MNQADSAPDTTPLAPSAADTPVALSGGGYAGGMFGRLVDTYGIDAAQALMARSDSPVLQWLRRNGRYVTPGGSRDRCIGASHRSAVGGRQAAPRGVGAGSARHARVAPAGRRRAVAADGGRSPAQCGRADQR